MQNIISTTQFTSTAMCGLSYGLKVWQKHSEQTELLGSVYSLGVCSCCTVLSSTSLSQKRDTSGKLRRILTRIQIFRKMRLRAHVTSPSLKVLQVQWNQEQFWRSPLASRMRETFRQTALTWDLLGRKVKGLTRGQSQDKLITLIAVMKNRRRESRD